MSLTELLLIAVGLSMDAVAVSMCKGLGMRRLDRKNAAVIALFFGGFQALMPLLGWLLGTQFARLIDSLDHWVVFGLLAFIGGKMMFDALRRGGGEEACGGDRLDIGELVMLAFATSVDALAVGISLAFLDVNIVRSAACIGCTTFLLSLAAVGIGHRFGAKHRGRAMLFGGAVLAAIGIKILLEHLGVFA